MVLCLAVVFLYISVFCIFGNRMTTQFEMMRESICQCAWNELPMRTKKLLPVFLIVAQNPIYIQGHMNTRCTHEMLKKVYQLNYIL